MLLKFAALVPTRKALKFEHLARADHGSGDMCPRVHSDGFLEGICQAPVFARQKKMTACRGRPSNGAAAVPAALFPMTLFDHSSEVNAFASLGSSSAESSTTQRLRVSSKADVAVSSATTAS